MDVRDQREVEHLLDSVVCILVRGIIIIVITILSCARDVVEALSGAVIANSGVGGGVGGAQVAMKRLWRWIVQCARTEP